MKIDANLNLTNAEMVYLVANTPMFIIRKLRLDPAVMQLASSHSSDDLYLNIVESLEIEPVTSRDKVLPIALLIALSLKPRNTQLLQLKDTDSSKYRWFKSVLDTVIANAKPTTINTIKAGRYEAKMRQVVSTSANETRNINMAAMS